MENQPPKGIRNLETSAKKPGKVNNLVYMGPVRANLTRKDTCAGVGTETGGDRIASYGLWRTGDGGGTSKHRR